MILVVTCDRYNENIIQSSNSDSTRPTVDSDVNNK